MSKQYGILVDVAYCFGCGVCVIACKQENNLPPYADDKPGTIGTSWNQVLQISEGVYPDVSVHPFPLHCVHCENPPCAIACPKDAINRSEDGIVLISRGKCNVCVDQPGGVKKCIPECPYGAIQFSEEKGAVEACTLCAHRRGTGDEREPACVRACIGRCLTFGDLNDPDSKISRKIREAGKEVYVLKPDNGTNPSIRYIKPPGVSLEKIANLAKAVVMYGYKKQPHV
ncbi:MAG: 4Fe-4S dicluster domain-containing protein [Dehalococcoidia bacterium]|nr:4Fe-4S dicluster domain-containing protein [Dehalococcoidia bacterium]